MFPAEVNGWARRQPAREFDPTEMCEVPLRMGFNTGIPGAPQLAGPAGAVPHRARDRRGVILAPSLVTKNAA